MTIFNEPRLALEFLRSEAPGYISRDTIVIAAGSGIVAAGTVLGLRVAGALASAVKASGANTGNGVLTPDATTPLLPGAQIGVYQVRFTSPTAFRVLDPTGDVIGDGAVGAAFADQVKFAIAAGATAFVAGDGFDLTANVTGGKYVPSPAAASDGSDVAAAINLLKVDATSADVACAAITSTAEVTGVMLTYEASVNSAALKGIKAAQLGTRNIKVR